LEDRDRPGTGEWPDRPKPWESPAVPRRHHEEMGKLQVR
jgi:hypothetical protein